MRQAQAALLGRPSDYLAEWQLGWLNMSTLMSGIFYLMAQFRIKKAEYKATRTLVCTRICVYRLLRQLLRLKAHYVFFACFQIHLLEERLEYVHIYGYGYVCVHSSGKCLWYCRATAGHIYELPPSMALCINF